jgi:hypothetical protein
MARFCNNRGNHMCNWEWKFLQNEITGTQTSFFSTNLGGKLSFILSFLFPERLHTAAAYIFHCSYLYNYYNYSRTLCIKCWVSSRDFIKFPYIADTIERGDSGVKAKSHISLLLRSDYCVDQFIITCLFIYLFWWFFFQTAKV